MRQHGRTQRVAAVMEDIRAAGEQQRNGVEQVNVAVLQMNGTTQSSASLTSSGIMRAPSGKRLSV